MQLAVSDVFRARWTADIHREWMGEPMNLSGDLLPPEAMYEASRLIARHVRWLGGLEWDFSRLHTMPIPPEFEALIRSYLHSVLTSPAEHKGWKIPETTLTFPWIVRMFPDVRYIFWIHNPRDCIIGNHITDNLGDWDVACPPTHDTRLRRAISWKYQYDLVRATPRPRHWIEVRFEDFVQRQDETLARLDSWHPRWRGTARLGQRALPRLVIAQHRFAKLDPRRPVPARVVRQQAMPDEDVTGGAVPFHARTGVEFDRSAQVFPPSPWPSNCSAHPKTTGLVASMATIHGSRARSRRRPRPLTFTVRLKNRISSQVSGFIEITSP